MTFLYSSSRLWKSGITSEMGTLSDWYLTIKTSIGAKMARALRRLFTNASSVTISLIFDLSLFWADAPCTKSRVVTMTCGCRSNSNKVWHMAWIVPQRVEAARMSVRAPAESCRSRRWALATWWLWKYLTTSLQQAINSSMSSNGYWSG